MEAPQELDAARAAELVSQGAQLVDVRELYEHEAGRIEGALHIELASLPAESGSIDRGRPVVFYCRTGARSGLATDAFRASGYEAYNLAGGLEAWVERGLPIEPEGGRVAAH